MYVRVYVAGVGDSVFLLHLPQYPHKMTQNVKFLSYLQLVSGPGSSVGIATD